MVPLPDGLVDKLHWPFQIFTAASAEELLKFFNVPVFRSDQFIQLPNVTLEIAKACSGVRYLISTMVLSIPLAFITQKSRVQRTLLFCFAALIGVCANPVRVTLVAVWAYYVGGDVHGPLHLFQGYVVYVTGMVILVTTAGILSKIPCADMIRCRKPESERPAVIGTTNEFDWAWFTSILMLLCLGTFPHLFKSEPVPLRTSLHELPVSIGEWNDTGIRSDATPFPIPGADSVFVRVYRNAAGREAMLQIAYFENQRRDKKLIHYSLKILHDYSEEISISSASRKSVRINKSLVTNGAQDSLILFWYDINSRVVANRYAAKLITAVDGIVHRRTNGAIIIVSSLTQSAGQDELLYDTVGFVQQLLPLLKTFIP
jgi:EpsI family protein